MLKNCRVLWEALMEEVVQILELEKCLKLSSWRMEGTERYIPSCDKQEYEAAGIKSRLQSGTEEH